VSKSISNALLHHITANHTPFYILHYSLIFQHIHLLYILANELPFVSTPLCRALLRDITEYPTPFLNIVLHCTTFYHVLLRPIMPKSDAFPSKQFRNHILCHFTCDFSTIPKILLQSPTYQQVLVSSIVTK